MEREKLTLTAEQGRAIIWEDNPNYKTISKTVVDNTRWSIIHDIVVQRVTDGKFFSSSYSTGATEQQDEAPYEYSEPNFTEVFPEQQTITVYK